MLTSLFVQRTNQRPLRAAGLFILLVLFSIGLISGGFLLVDVPVPEWFAVVGRWLPALVSLLVLRLVPLEGGILTWWSLRPGGWRRLLGGGATAVAVLIVVYALSVLPVIALGPADPQPWPALAQVAVLLVPAVLLFSLSTLGEEAAWRGFLQRALSTWGFWRSAMAISAVWVLFHVPLHGVMAIQGVLPWDIAVVSTVGLFPLGLYLSAVVSRFGSVWPAVFAHALPFSALNLLTDVDGLAPATLWTLTAVTAVLLTGAAALFAPRARRRRPRHPE